MKKGKLAILGVVCAAVVSFSGFVGWFATQLGFKNINIDNVKGYFHSIKEGKTEEYKANVKLEGKLKEIKKKFGEEVYNQQIAIREELKNLPPDVDPNTPGLTETEKTVWEMTANLKSKFTDILKPEFDSNGVLTSGTYVTKINGVYKNSSLHLDLETISIDEDGMLIRDRGLYQGIGGGLSMLKNVSIDELYNFVNSVEEMGLKIRHDIGLNEDIELINMIKNNYLLEVLQKEYINKYDTFTFVAQGLKSDNKGRPISMGFIISCSNSQDGNSEFINILVPFKNINTYEDALLMAGRDGDIRSIIKQPKRIPLGEEYANWKEVTKEHYDLIEKDLYIQNINNIIEEQKLIVFQEDSGEEKTY